MSTLTSLSPASFLRHASDVSSFYGFKPIHAVEKGLPGKRSRAQHTYHTSIESCIERMVAQKTAEPVLAYYVSATPLFAPLSLPARDIGEFGLHVLGTNDSLGEILLLKTLFAIVSEWGGAFEKIRVNALGDRDSKIRFERELSNYLRKHIHSLDPECRKILTENPLAVYTCQNEQCKQLLSEAPRSISFLSEKSRAHLREVLEYIESLGLMYEVDDMLMGDIREPRVTFAFDLQEINATVMGGSGGRFDDHVKKVSTKKDGAGVSASIYFRKKGLVKSSFVIPASTEIPKIYFVQLGLRAKLQGLSVVDMLRDAKVPIAQSFDVKSLGPQMATAREQGVSHLLIMGQREALDGTIIVRSMLNSSQQIVSIAALPRLLKSLKV